jgi:hypothetical protein
LEKIVCLEKNDANKYKETGDGKLHYRQNITTIKNNLHEVSFFLFCLTKLIKILFQFLNLFDISILKIVKMWTHDYHHALFRILPLQKYQKSILIFTSVIEKYLWMGKSENVCLLC